MYHPGRCTEKNKSQEDDRITVVLRYDDYSSRSNTGIELKLIDILRRHHLRCTFGVIPFVCAGDGYEIGPQETLPLSKDKAEILKSAIKEGLLEVAQHGWRHQNILPYRHPWWSDFFGVKYSEFFGLDYHSQLKRIQEGRKFLSELLKTEISTFIPPWNSYDQTTLSVLEELGFNYISAGVRGSVTKNSNLRFLPATCSVSQLREVIKRLRNQKCNRPLIVVMLHEFEIFESGSKMDALTLEELDDLFSWLNYEENISIKSINQIGSSGEGLNALRFRNYNLYHKALFFLPPFLNPGKPGYYLTTEISSLLKFKYWAFTLLYYSAILILSSIISLKCWIRFYTWSVLTKTALKYAGPLAFALLSIGAWHTLPLGYQSLSGATLFVGISFGAFAALLLLRRKPAK